MAHMLAALFLVGLLLAVVVSLAHRIDKRLHAEFLASIDTLTDAQKAKLASKAAAWKP